MGTCAIGAAVDVNYQLHGILSTLGAIAGIVMVGLSPSQQKKLMWLFVTAFCMGCNLGPLIEHAIETNVE